MSNYSDINFFSVQNNIDFKNQNSDIIIDLLRGCNVSVLAGGSKTGKSALALDMAYSIATGQKFLGFQCIKNEVLYISLDNDEYLIGERISKMQMKDVPNLKFCCNLFKLGSESRVDNEELYLIDVLSKCISEELPNLKVVFIDLWDNVREVDRRNEYSNAYAQSEIEYLKALALQLGVSFVLLTHVSKSSYQRGYNAAKGATEFIGTINGTYMNLIRNGIGETSAVLEIGGRNVREKVLHIKFNSDKIAYELDDISEDIDFNVALIRNYINTIGEFQGTASLLCSEAKLLISATSCGKLLTKYKKLLESEGIHITFPTNHHSRNYHIVSDNFQKKS